VHVSPARHVSDNVFLGSYSVFKLKLKYNFDYRINTVKLKSNTNIRKMGMMIQRFITVLLMVVLVGSVCAEDVKEVVVASAQELKGIKAKKITWQKDGAKMVLVKPYVPEVGDTIKTAQSTGSAI